MNADAIDEEISFNQPNVADTLFLPCVLVQHFALLMSPQETSPSCASKKLFALVSYSCSTFRFAYFTTGNFAKLCKQKIVCTCLVFLFSSASFPVQCCSESRLDAFVHRLRECFGRVDISRLLHKKDRASKCLLYLSLIISQDSYLALLERSEGGLMRSIIISQDWADTIALLFAPVRREHTLVGAVTPFGVVFGGLEEVGSFSRELLHH